jgi:hypothetical protein
VDLAEIQRHHANKESPIPDEESARKYCLGTEVEAPDLVTVKDFLRFYIATSRPLLTSKPRADSINTVAE